MFFWMIFSFFNVMFYASMIKASLTIQGKYSPITSLKEVVESGLPYTLFTDPVEETNWALSPDPFIRFEIKKLFLGVNTDLFQCQKEAVIIFLPVFLFSSTFFSMSVGLI